MSKIFEALENAEKQRLRKGSSPFPEPNSIPVPAPKEEKKTPPIVGPRFTPQSPAKEEQKAAPVPEPREVKRTAPVAGSALTPAQAPREEKKTAPALEPKSGWVGRSGVFSSPKPEEVKGIAKEELKAAPAPKEEKKTSSVPEPSKSGWPKSGWMDKPAPSLAPEPGEVKRNASVVSPTVTLPPPKEEKRPLPVPEPMGEWVERSGVFPSPKPEEVKGNAKEEPKIAPVLAPKEEKKIPPVVAPKFAPPTGPKEEKKIPPTPQPKEVRVERHQETPPSKTVSKQVHPERRRPDRLLVSLFEPGSLGAEQFRKLRTHVVKLNMPNPPRTIMVTSATEGEGKTFVAANLAAGIAHDLHFHALLVDCDLRNPSISQWFGVQNGHGLSDYLVGRGQLSELLMRTEMEKLSILTGGSTQEKPVELIGSKKMEALINELKSRYPDRYIILDSTPLLATAEPEVLARLVDGILIVVRANVTPRETVRQAVASLDPKKILGFVLNDVEFKSPGLFSRYFGSDGYYAKYGYGYGKRGTGSQGPSREVSPLKKRSG